MAGRVRVSISAETNELRQGLEKAAGMLKGLQQKSGQAAGATRQFAGAIEAIGGASSGATRLASNLLGAFAVGGPMGLAIGGVNALVGHFQGLNREQAAAEKAAQEWGDGLNAQIRRNTADLAVLKAELADDKVGATRARADADVEEARRALEAGVLERSKAERELAEMRTAFVRLLPQEEALEARINGELTEKVRLLREVLAQEEAKAAGRVEQTAKDVQEDEKTKADRAAKAVQEAEEKKRAEMKKTADWAKEQNEKGKQALREMAAAEKEKAAEVAEFLRQVKIESDEVLAEINKKQAEKEKAAREEQLEDVRAFSSELGSAMAGVITGQKTAAEGARQITSSIVSSILDMTTKSIMAKALDAGAGAAVSQSSIPFIGPALAVAAMTAMVGSVRGLLGGLPGRAFGGPVAAGRPYLVGELGVPEVFVPETSGTIIPGQDLGGRPLHLHVAALDGASVERVLTSNARDVSRALRKMQRLGR